MFVGGIRVLWNELTWYTVIHMFAGIVTVVGAVWVSPMVAALAFVGFMVYELNEDMHISDEAFKDILEYCIGLYVAIVGMMII